MLLYVKLNQILAILLFISYVSLKNCTNKDTLIKELPGFNQTELPCMFSGFISIDESSNSKLFYWFIEADDSANKPLVIWLNGGPGISSLVGLFTEIGPLFLGKNGEFFIDKETSFISKANVLFVDQPVGTGYSFTDNFDAIPKNQNEVAVHFYKFLQTFFLQYSQYTNSNVYLMGESYSGKFIPSIAEYILKENQSHESKNYRININIKKIAIGNGLFVSKYQRPARKDLAKGLNIISEFDDEAQLDNLVNKCETVSVYNSTDASGKCESILNFITELSGDVSPYDVRRSSDFDKILFKKLDGYLNRDEVADSLHVKGKSIKSSPYWATANETVKYALKDDINLISSVASLENLLNNYDIPIIIYAGQFDLVDGPQGIERVLNSLKINDKDNFKNSSKQLWKIKTLNNDYITAGYIKQYKNLVFLTMRNAGHFSPRDRIGSSLDILAHLLSKDQTWACPDGRCSLASIKCEAMSHCSNNGGCGPETGGRCQCNSGYFGPDCSLISQILLSKSVIKLPARNVRLFNLSHYETDVILELASDSNNVMLSLVHKENHENIYNSKDNFITYKLENQRLVLYIEKERFLNYLIVIKNLDFNEDVNIKVFVNTNCIFLINFRLQ
jgi:carboxypeptidase C (cathepsin A)